MRHRRRQAVLIAAAAILAGAAACTAPARSSSDISAGQMIVELSDALNDIRQDNALLQAQIDSLRGEVARQDTLLTRVAAAAGISR